MKITCERSTLAAAIAGVSRAVTLRSSVPALEGILFEADGSSLTLTGYDLELAITTTLPAQIREGGAAVLPAKLIGELVRRLPADTVTIECGEALTATVQGGITQYDIAVLSAADYPELPTMALTPASETNQNGVAPAVSLPGSLLKEMIETTIYAVSQDDKKPANTGEKFELTEEGLTLVALDGFRLAVCRRPAKGGREVSIIIPAKALLEVSRLIGEGDEEVQISASRRYVVFQLGGYTVLSRLLDDAFLDYKRTISPTHLTRVVVETRAFCDSIERASLIITERLKNPLRVTFDEELTVRCQTELGKVQDSIPCEFEGQPMEIGFNNRYLLDALRNSGCDKVAFELNGPLAPVKVLPVEGEDFIFLVMPVRFKND